MGAIGPGSIGRATAFAPGDIAKSLAGWTDLGDSGSGLTQLDIAGSGIQLTMDGTDNDCETAEYMGESVDPATVGTHFGFTAIINVTEAATNASDWFIGFSDTATSSLWSDADALASGVHIGFAKYTASMFFRRIVQQSTTNSGDTSASSTAFVTATDYFLELRARVGTAGIYADFLVNNVRVGSSAISGVATTGYGLMAPCFAISTNGTNAENFKLKSFIPYSIPA